MKTQTDPWNATGSPCDPGEWLGPWIPVPSFVNGELEYVSCITPWYQMLMFPYISIQRNTMSHVQMCMEDTLLIVPDRKSPREFPLDYL